MMLRPARGHISNSAAPIFDAHGILIGSLDVMPVGAEGAQPDALTSAVIRTTARAIEERAFRERHRRDWIIAVVSHDLAGSAMLFAIDRNQSIVGADRFGRALLAGGTARDGAAVDGIGLWSVFERDAALFRDRDHGDITSSLVLAGTREVWSALVTPPESDIAPWRGPDAALHARPRLDGIGRYRQLNLPPQARGGLSPVVLRRVREHIDANLDATIDIEALAAIAALSRCHFARAFKQSVGVTPHGYLMHRRVRKAQELLTDTAFPLAQIALATGFSDQSHFSRRFRQCLGISPSTYRRTHQ